MPVSNPPVERTLPPPAEPELYCIPDDPWEARNLAAAHPEPPPACAWPPRTGSPRWRWSAERREFAAGLGPVGSS